LAESNRTSPISKNSSSFKLLAVPLGVVLIVVMLVVPLPSFILDILITINITAAMLVLLTAMNVKKPLEFSVFPTLLLMLTVFRLALNVSATRLVLLHAYAGVVIESFGHFVIGGSILVGLVVFLILIIIQFVVITSGSGRVAEVAARFTLDAMPGKQMAVDGELASQLITAEQAKQRRAEIAEEADFYGAMDGASKFVRGDAIAAIVITLINLLGGLAIGVLQHHDSLSQAISTYSTLSVGDGLVSQIPALLLSLSTGIIVTRAATEDDLGTNVLGQLSRYRRVVKTAASVIFILGIMPGLPKIPFLLVGGILFVLASRLPKDEEEHEEIVTETLLPPPPSPDAPAQLAKEAKVMPLELELGLDVIDLVDPRKRGDLLERVKGLRRALAHELGIVIPPIHAKDNDQLPPTHYAFRIHGVQVAESEAPPGFLLAVGDGLEHLDGVETKDPAYGGGAKWILPELRYRATVTGATVVERSAVITTHLAEIVRKYAGELLSRQDVKLLIDSVKNEHPVAIEEMASVGVSLGHIQNVLRNLLDEQIPVKDLVRIIEAVTDQAVTQIRDLDSLTEAARMALAPQITALCAHNSVVNAIVLEPALEQDLASHIQITEHGRYLGNSAEDLEHIIASIQSSYTSAETLGKSPVLICSSYIRPALRRLIRTRLANLQVISAAEVAQNAKINTIGVIYHVANTTV